MLHWKGCERRSFKFILSGVVQGWQSSYSNRKYQVTEFFRIWEFYTKRRKSSVAVDTPKMSRDEHIDVGRGPSGPSIEGPFCRTVRLCRTLGERKVGKKNNKKGKKWRKKEGKIEKREKEMRKKGKLQRFCLFSMHFCLFRVILCFSDSSFCRTARLCRTLEGRWRPDTSHCPTSMAIPNIEPFIYNNLYLSTKSMRFFLFLRIYLIPR